MTLKARMASFVAAAVALAVAAVALAAFVSAHQALRAEIDEFLRQRAALIGAATIEPGRFGDFRRPFREPVRIAGDLVFADSVLQIIDTEGTVLLSTDATVSLPVEAPDLDVATGTRNPFYRDVAVDGTRLRMLTAPVRGGGAVQIARDLSEASTVQAVLGLRLLLIGMVGVGVAALFGWLVADRALRPVEALTAAAERVAETQALDSSIDVRRDDEVGRLADSFNTMLAALATSRRQQRQLVSNASHELRTPLTSLTTNVELLRRTDSLPEQERREILHDIHFEVEELTLLVSELVELATDVQRTEEPQVSLRLDQIVAEVVDRARRRTGRTIELRTTPTVVEGRAEQLARAVGNLIDNAHKWSPVGAPIEVDVAGGRVSVHDHGPGVPEDERARIFDRFYRADAARSVPGSGLGLAIVQQIVDYHEGGVFVTESEHGGAVVGFELPLLPEDDGP